MFQIIFPAEVKFGRLNGENIFSIAESERYVRLSLCRVISNKIVGSSKSILMVI